MPGHLDEDAGDVEHMDMAEGTDTKQPADPAPRGPASRQPSGAPPARRDAAGTTAADVLLHRAAQYGLDCPDLRRFCALCYRPGKVWGLLAALPEGLRAALRADHGPDDAGPGGSGGGLDLALTGWGSDGGAAGGAADSDGADEAERAFGAAEERMRRAMEEDGEVGYLEVAYDPATQRRTRLFLNHRFAALRGAARPALLARLAAHAADLPAPAGDCLAALLHGLLHRRAADCTQYVRVDCGGRGLLAVEHSRKRFDGRGRVVKVSTLDDSDARPVSALGALVDL